MNRDQKSAIVAELNELFTRAKFSVVTDYCGLKVSELEKIRTELRGCNSEIRIAKNTLLKRAVTDTACESLTDEFIGTTAIVVAYDDPVIPAKVLAKFAEDHERFQLRSAVLEGEKITVDNIVSLSKLPSKEVLTWPVVVGDEWRAHSSCSCSFRSAANISLWSAGNQGSERTGLICIRSVLSDR